MKIRVKRSIIESKRLNANPLYGSAISYVLSTLILRGYSKEIIRNKFLLNRLGNNITRYYLAKAYFLNGNFEETEKLTLEIMSSTNKHAETLYLLSNALNMQGRIEEARNYLYNYLECSPRIKTWLNLANLVTTEKDFAVYEKKWESVKSATPSLSYNFDLINYISTAALRSKSYEYSFKLWEEFISNLQVNEIVFKRSSEKKFNSDSASNALIELKHVLDRAGVDFFLISGTLLGCIRNGELLGHDKDIDVGIWNDISLNTIKETITTSGIFELQAMRSDYALRVKHVNGISIDLFFHYKDKNNYWHAGVKLKWNNSPFSLVKHKFLNSYFLIPKNYDLYLTENYGDWKTVKKDFDSTFDTPNSTIISISEVITHTYRSIAQCILSGNNEKASILERKLKKLKADLPKFDH